MAKRIIFVQGKDFHAVDEHAQTIMLHGERAIELRHCQTPKDLYCSSDGAFYMRYGNELHPIKSSANHGNWKRTGGWGNYAYVSNLPGSKTAHRLMAVWLPEPKEGETEIDHINGVATDNRAVNLEWVSPEENRKRARVLRVLRRIGRDPKEMSREELLGIFAKYEFRDPATEVPDTGHRKPALNAGLTDEDR